MKPEDVIDLTEYLFEQDEDAGREQEVTREELLEVILKIRGGREISNQDVSSRIYRRIIYWHLGYKAMPRVCLHILATRTIGIYTGYIDV